MAKKKRLTWAYSPSRDPKATASEATRAEVERKANELIEAALNAKHVLLPPKNPEFNYVIGISTKWHGRYFYLVATYACQGAERDLPDLRGQLCPTGAHGDGAIQPGVHAAHRKVARVVYRPDPGRVPEVDP